MSGENRIVPLNGQQSGAAQQQRVAGHVFEFYLRAPGLPDNAPVGRVVAPDVRSAMLIFLAQMAGDVSQIRELRIKRQDSGIITPM